MPHQAYIVTFKSASEDSSFTTDQLDSLAAKVESSGGSIKHKYDSRVMRGFAGELPDEMVKELEGHASVKSIEKDGEVKTQ